MKDTSPTSFALPVVSDATPAPASSHGADHTHDAVGEMFDAAASVPAASGTTPAGYGKTYWRSIEEKLATPEFLEATRPEFPEGADLPPSGFMRREFMQLLGASLALAGVSACSTRPVNEKMLPYTKTPTGLAPGNPLTYASAFTFGGHTSGLLVTAWEGRPTKVEGNPQHPVNQGAAGPFEQALLLSLYDPQRARVLRQGKSPKALRTLAEDVAALVNKAAATDGGAKIRFLVEPNAGPTLQDLRKRIGQKLPQAKFVEFVGVTQDPASEGANALFGQSLTALYDFSQADVILSLDADFLESRPANLAYARAFANRRDPNVGELNRLYVAEPRMTITGGMADHRLRVKSAEVAAVAAAVLQAVGGPAAQLASAAGKFPLPPSAQKFVATVAADLKSKAGRSVVVAGERMPAAVHAMAHAINAALGSVGKTVTFVPAPGSQPTGPSALRALAEELKSGAADTLVITAWNPVYAAPADAGLAELLDATKNANRGNLRVLYTSMHEDETSAHADWFVPAAHPMETWADGRSIDGTVTLGQPLIQPLYNGVSESELLALFLGNNPNGALPSSYALLRDYWRTQAGAGDFETAWETWVGEGFVPRSAAQAVQVTPDYGRAAQALAAYQQPAGGELEINFVPDYKVYDGRFANNAWLQELAHPVTKMTWDNAALLSPATAGAKNLEAGDVVTIQYGGRSLEAPVWIVPGHADDTLTLAIGYGRTGLHETVAQGVGVNANLLRRTDAPWFDGGATVTKVRKSYKFSLTQIHWRMEGRPLALDMSYDEFKKEPKVLERVRGEQVNLLADYPYEGYKWGMAIDLARCTGCAACVVACQAENNIPVVGKEQVGKGREMAWLRIDRYFSGDERDPEMVMQPVMCVHCEKAPCEYVCPVNATVHSDEGLNEMVYNRCVGTRYCSNNCPYKVRRFNYLHFTGGKTAPEKMLMNPDVTVRARGVMEKCTYCVQRIERTRINSRIEKRSIREAELKTACQQTCPTQAIVFGTLQVPKGEKPWAVAALHEDPRAYKLLHELGTRPRTSHLVRVRNPHPDLVAEAPQAEHEGGH
ncbi:MULTISPECIES: TAT-variant-translocated molybdopterin oxidoreductase [Myxococcaceae]|uniref:TAT-variant-translocated molybdopterin oxidoreductase n=1 Tax=Myxococcaceae TaxID=31 RepID=UPI001E36E82A|nr:MULTISPECIES: TAT-variant-translocated molybdopterin oxidoreductase [Myxococcaceae]